MHMPIYEYVCMQCESHFEELVRNHAQPDCPECGAADVRKQLSVFAAHASATQVSVNPAPRSSRRLLRRFLRLRLVVRHRA